MSPTDYRQGTDARPRAASTVGHDCVDLFGGDGLEVTCGAEHARWPVPDLRAVWGALAPLFP